MEPTNPWELWNWLQQLQQGRNAGPQWPAFIKPFHLVSFALANRQDPTLRPTIHGKAATYAMRMRLFEAAGLEPPANLPERDPDGRFLPALALDADTDPGSVAGTLRRIADVQGVDEGTVESLETTLIEILGNCTHHGESLDSITALTAAQAWPRGARAQIAVADLGVGMRGSLAHNPSLDLEHWNSCELAAQYGVTSKPEGHSGYGLTLARELMERNGGRFLLASGDELFMSDSGTTFREAGQARWPGTLVVLEWRLDRPLNVRDVYDSWPLPEGFDHDDFDLQGFDDLLT